MSSSCFCSTNDIGITPSLDLPVGPGAQLLTIFGSRSYGRLGRAVDLADDIIDEIRARGLEFDAIVSGGAAGADDIAEVVGVKLGVPVIVLNAGGRPATERHSIRADMSDAPFVVHTVAPYGDPDIPCDGGSVFLYRNCFMAELTAQHDGCGLAIWDGTSNGTQHMMDACKQHGVPYSVVEFTP